MQSRFSLTKGNLQGLIFATCCLFVVSLAKDFQMSDGVMRDPFHQGEYFSALVTILDGQAGFQPLTIHGALDYIPGLIAQKFFGQENYFFPTRLIYLFLNFFAAMVLLAISFLLVRRRPQQSLVLAATALVAPIVVGYRDAALLLSVYLYFLIQEKNHPAVNFALEVLFGMTVAFGFFWSFDRGIAAVVSLGAACLIHAYNRQRYLSSVVVCSATIISLGYIWPQFTLGNYWNNLRVLIETSSQWSYGWQIWSIELTSVLGFANILAIGLVSASVINSKTSGANFANSLMLICLSIFLFKMGSNRADMQHFLWALLGPLLAGLYWYSNDQSKQLNFSLQITLVIFLTLLLILGYEYKVIAFIPIAALLAYGMLLTSYPNDTSLFLNRLLAATLALPLVAAIYSISIGLSSGRYQWVHYFSTLPHNTELATDGVRWASQELMNSGSHCVFDLSNNGLTALPTCSRFSYLVYADSRYEDEIIGSLSEARPKAIIYSSTFWSFSIDGRTMHARFPRLDNFLQSTYVEEKCSSGYCVRYLGGAK